MVDECIGLLSPAGNTVGVTSDIPTNEMGPAHAQNLSSPHRPCSATASFPEGARHSQALTL